MKKIFTLAVAAFAGLAAMAQNMTQANFFGVMVPQYMGSGTSTRLEVVYRARVNNLAPNTQYRYTTQAIDAADLGQATSGAGNPLFINYGGQVLYTTQPRVTQASASGSFTTNAQGEYTGWFAYVNTANRRFGSGLTVTPAITVKAASASAADTVTKRYALDQNIQVLGFAATAGPNNGTGIYGRSQAQGKNVVALYADAAATGRPLSMTYAEDIGDSIASMPSWYKVNVRRQAGAWGTLIPNLLAGGVQNISQYDQDGNLVGNNTSADGTWGTANTVNPSGGSTTPVVIAAGVAPLNVVTAIRAGRQNTRFTAYVAEGRLNIQGRNACQLRVLDLTGKPVASLSVAEGQTAFVSTAAWAPGLYLVVDATSRSIERVVVR